MTNQYRTAGLCAIFFFIAHFFFCCSNERDPGPVPPEAPKIEKKMTIHGDTRVDNYYWINRREDPQVIRYIKKENEYTRSFLKHTDSLREQLFREMIDRLPGRDHSVPYLSNGYRYYERFEEGSEYPVIFREKVDTPGVEEMILNANELSEGLAYFMIGDWEVSPDNRLLAYSMDTVSRRKYVVCIKDLATGRILTDRITNTTGSVTWANDNKTLFYVQRDEALRPDRIFRHHLGSETEEDVMVFYESDPTYRTFVYRSKSDKYLFIGSESTRSTEYRILEADDPEGEFRMFQPRRKDLLYTPFHHEDDFILLTNLDAPDFRIMKTPEEFTNIGFWSELLPHKEDTLITDVEIFKTDLVIIEKEGGIDQLRIIDMSNLQQKPVRFQEETYCLEFSDNHCYEAPAVRITYTSLTTPQTTYEIDLTTLNKTMLKQNEVEGDFQPENYHSERIFAHAEDGERIPVSIVYRKGLQKNGNNPLWIKGYGAYGYDSDPVFRSERLSLLDRGFVYAIAHVRGGQEMGRRWYEEGRLLNKKKTFTDFIACTQMLINENYTTPEKIVAWGGSAGGLLIGAVMNMRPDLYGTMIAAVPFVDVVTTMLDETIPLTTSEYDEWGNPNHKEYYDYMRSYSPYDNVEPEDYPALLVTTGFHDSQVQYWEPVKWVAKLRANKTDGNPLLLFVQMDYGHGGASGRYEMYKEIALEYTFVFDRLGIE